MSALKAVLEVIRAGYVPIRRDDYENILNDIDRLENECKRLKDENAVLRSCAVTIADDGNVWKFGTLVRHEPDAIDRVTISAASCVSPTAPAPTWDGNVSSVAEHQVVVKAEHAKPTC